MHIIPGFSFVKSLEENTFSLYKAIRKEDKIPVIIKSIPLSETKGVKLLKHEYQVVSGLDSAYVLHPVNLEQTSDTIGILYEDFSGELLSQFSFGKDQSIKQFLKIAILISKALADLHNNSIVHKDINPQNILVNPDTYEIKIINFGISTLLPSDFSQTISPEYIEGSLPYISPEQTGRMNRNIDYHTDMYSLGVTYYLMLTGKLPFEAQDPLEWIYNHIVRTPKAPSEISSDIPKVLSDIIMKLLSKLSEDRYQSMEGLAYDLKKCLSYLDKQESIKSFPLGESDISKKFQISQKIYGREKEIHTLQSNYENVAKTGIAKLILISGYSGIGKTALVKEFRKTILSNKGYFLAGKFEQFKRDTPYLTIVEAFKTMVQIILTEPDEVIKKWKKEILNAVGINGSIIINIIPQVKLIIGKQPSVPELAPTESRNRFEMVFQKFIGVFTKEENPLVVFLDDLQWADWASLNLIQKIIVNSEIKHIILIGAYRDNEVFPSHPLVLTLKEIHKTKAIVDEIKLSPLNKENVGKLVADSLIKWSGDNMKLSELIYEKTAGNPFFTIQFLKNLYQESLLKFDSKSSSWKWELDKIKAKQYTTNVLDFFAGKIKNFDIKTRNLLSIAACIGNSFQISTLTSLAEEKEEEVAKELQEPLSEGLIISYDSTVKFLHDRIQQAAYSLNSDQKLNEVHLKIGRLMLAKTPEEEINDLVFEIVTNFNLGDHSLLDEEEKNKVAKLNLLAARKAKASNAYDSAIKFAIAGLKLFSEKDWKDQYEMIFNLHLEKAELEYLNGNLTDAEKQIDFLAEKAFSNIDKASVCLVKMRVNLVKGEMLTVIKTALQYLEIFKITIPLKPTKEDVLSEYEKVNKNIGERRIKDLIDLPLMTNNETKAAMEILSELYGPAYFYDTNLYFLQSSYMINLSIQYGNTSASVLGYGDYGLALAVVFNKYKEGYEFAELGVKLAEKHKYLTFTAKAIHFLGLMSFWRKEMNISIDQQKQSFQMGLETGDIQIASYSGVNYIDLLNIKGEKLDIFYHEIKGYMDFVRKVKFVDMETDLIIHQVYALSLQGLTDNVSTFNSPDFNEQEFEKTLDERIPLIKCWYYIVKLKARYITGNYEDALIAANKAKELIKYTLGLCQLVDFYFFYSLTLTAKYTSESDEEKASYLETLRHNQNLLKAWAESCKENFQSRYALVSAEISRISKKNEKAIFSYEESIKSAKENSLIIDEAISYEVASRFYSKRKFEKFARLYSKEAKECYSRWGARGKVRQMETLYPFLREQEKPSISDTLGGIPTDHLDMLSLYKASQIISGEIVFERLIRKLVKIVIQQAGAQKAYIILEHEKKLRIAAEAAIVDNEIAIKVYETFQKANPKTIPINLVQYVKRTQEKTILQDTTLTNKFSNDPYFIKNHPKSIACLPFLKQDKLMGMIYLENNIYSNVFSHDKISVLEILSSQAAISIENSILFRELKKSEEKFRFLSDIIPVQIYTQKPDGELDYANKNSSDYFGKSPAKIKDWNWESNIHPDDFEFAASTWEKSLEEGESSTYEARFRRKDGVYRWFLIRNNVQKDEAGNIIKWFGTATDINELKKIEAELRIKNKEIKNSEEEIRFMTDAVPTIFWTNDPDGNIDYFNKKIVEYTGYSREETKGWKWEKIVHPDDLESTLKMWKDHLASGKLFQNQLRLRRKDGMYRWHLARAIPQKDDRGNIVKWFGTITDIHSQKEIEEYLKFKNEELKQVNVDLDSFIYTASHDLKAPISNIEGLINALKSMIFEKIKLNKDINQIFEMQETSIEKFKNVLIGLSDITQAQKSRKEDIKEVSFSDVLKEIEISIDNIIKSNEAEIKANFSKCPTINFAPKNLRTVLFNLVSNAIKFRSPEKKPVVTITTEENNEYIILKVQDNGIGIPSDKIEKVFTMFKKLHATEEGTGIGLYIVKRIVTNAGGKVEVQSEEGKGSTFTVYFKRFPF